jgi:phosphoglycerate kinase
MANTFIKTLGYEIGQSYFEPDYVKAAESFLNQKHNARIILPSDFAVLNSNTSLVEILNANKLKNDSIIYDLGPESVFEVCNIIKSSKVVLWNGPLGLFEDNRFTTATFFVARYISKLTKEGNLKSVIGGGDVVAAVEKAGVANSISYISTAGGAFLEYLEEGNLPGINELKP